MGALGVRGRAALLASALAVLSCSGLRFPGFGGGSRVTEEELSAQVLDATGRFGVTVTGAAEAIAAQTHDRDVRRRALLWKVRMTPLVARAALGPNPMKALVELLALAVAQRQYLVQGSGKFLFADQQPIAQEAATDLEHQLRALPRTFLSEKQALEVEAEVELEAERFPIRGEFLVADAHDLFAAVESSSTLDEALKLPLAPFRAFSGVESGAAAMHELNATGRQFNAVLASLPQQARWQLELLLYDIEDRETVVSGLRAFEQMAASSSRFAAAVEGLPDSARRELEALLARSDASQAQLRATLQTFQAGIADANRLVAGMQPVAGSLERMAAHVEGASASLGELARSLRSGADVGAPGPLQSRGRVFDIRDYEKTAVHVEGAAAQVRGLLSEVREGPRAGPGWIDHLFWRAVLLLVVWFALRLGYRLALSSLTAPGAGARRRG